MSCCMSTLYFALLVTASSGSFQAAGDSPNFQSSAVRTAQARYNKELNQIQLQFDRQLALLRNQLRKTLETELKATNQRKNTAEASKLAEAIQSIRPLNERLVGTRWKWHTGRIVVEFSERRWTMTGPDSGGGTAIWKMISPNSIQSVAAGGGSSEFIFNSRMTHFMMVNDKGVMRYGVLIQK